MCGKKVCVNIGQLRLLTPMSAAYKPPGPKGHPCGMVPFDLVLVFFPPPDYPRPSCMTDMIMF